MLKIKMRNSLKTEKGSSLLELLVAFAIISLAMTVVVDSFITSQRSYRITSEQADLARILTRVLEDMSIEARISEQFRSSDGYFMMNHIAGLNAQTGDEVVQYRLTTDGRMQKDNNDSENFLDMTPSSIYVDDFIIQVNGTPPDEVRALVILKAHEVANSNNTITLQTSFTERAY